ncbi:MAG: tetratricopeptide repeat protein [Deltaproteobacteria bacterium]|nr:tetratricopeptide repeat protein [Deltaproteobacteria bacterium]
MPGPWSWFLLGADASLVAVKQLILSKTEGTPFFMEEVVQEFAETGVLVGDRGQYHLTQHTPTLHLPPTVQSVLAARIDRLAPDEKALLQQLSVIGREFPLSLVRQVIDHREEELYRLLAALQRKEFLYEQPSFPEVEYIFKHALTQEVAYGTVLIERRKALHEQTAQAIERLFHNRLEEHYDELAHHYSRSPNTEKAVKYLHLAGQQAVQQSANAEAINYLTTALELLKTLPDTTERVQQELTLQIALGVPLAALKGHAAPEVERAFTRARELCQQVGETPQLFPALWGLWLFYLVRAELQRAQELGEQCLTLVQGVQDPALLLEAHYALGITLLWSGKLARAQKHFEQAIALYDPLQHHSLTFRYGGYDPGLACLIDMAWTLWSLGYPNQASKRIHEALILAEELSHPFSLGMTLNWAAVFHQFRREERLAQKRAEAAMSLSTEQGFPDWLAWGTVLRGWALTEQGQGEEGIAQLRQGIATFRATGTENGQPYFLALLTEAYRRMGQREEGLNMLVEALAAVNKSGERWYEAELYRLKGELLLAQSGASLGQVQDKSQASQNKSEVPNTQHPTSSTQRN